MAIDEFLLNYRHHQDSIQDFMSCLDDTHLTLRGTRALDPIVMSDFTLSDEPSTSSSEVEFDSDSSGVESPRKPCSASRQVIRKALQPKKTMDHKHTLTAEEKDERRRFQNREAQRRFRERHMLEAYRKASSNLHGQLLGWLHAKQSILY
jgi:hypothetical protein